MIWKAAFGRLQVGDRYGWEYFRDGWFNLPFTLLNLWERNTLELSSNAARTALAEFLISRAIYFPDKPPPVATGSDFDLATHTGVRVKVATAAYVPSWPKERLAAITFDIAPKWGWNAATNRVDDALRRPADVYVFALLHHEDGKRINIVDVGRWTFFVVASHALDTLERAAPFITLKSLRARCGGPMGGRAGPLWRGPVPYLKLRVEVEGLGDTLRAMGR